MEHATPRTDRGKGQQTERRGEVGSHEDSTIKLCCYRRTGPRGLVPFATLCSQLWFSICKITHLKHSTDTWRFGSGAAHLFDGLSSSTPSESRRHSLRGLPQPPPPPSLTKITTEDSPIFICLILSQLILISTRPSFIPHPRLIRTLSSPSAAIQPFRRFFPHHTLLPSTGPATGNLAWAQQIVVKLIYGSLRRLLLHPVSQNPRRLPLTSPNPGRRLSFTRQPGLEEAIRDALSVTSQRRNGNRDFPGQHYPRRGAVSGCLVALTMRSGRIITDLGARPPGFE